ncbi:MAG: carbohydrate ABC transporter permease [Anaerolineae bacterium]|nr:carbohydrate ABC transporter permease [Anaerolineae bacterium]
MATIVQAQPTSAAILRRRKFIRKGIASTLKYLILSLTASMFIIPFIWLLITSLKVTDQVFTDPPIWIPNPIAWVNYTNALLSPAFPFLNLMKNTLFYVLSTTLGTLVSSALVAYGFSRIRFQGRDFLFAVTLSTMMMPGIVTLIPTYVLFKTIGWVGSYAPLVVPSFFGAAFNIFLLRQFMITVPYELTDAALVDGANHFDILWRIMIPLVKPAFLVIGVMNVMWVWNDFMGPLIYLSDQKMYPLVMGLSAFQTQHSIIWNQLMAASLATCFPLIVLFFIAQRYFIEGITLTGLKGV